MSPKGRPEGECRSAQHGGTPAIAVEIGTPLTAAPAPAGGTRRRGQLPRSLSLLLIAPLDFVL